MTAIGSKRSQAGSSAHSRRRSKEDRADRARRCASNNSRFDADVARRTSRAGRRVELLFVSEDTVPTAFFDAIAARRLSLLNDVDLHFDASECKAMTAALRIAETNARDLPQ
jgi:hypothetical protein